MRTRILVNGRPTTQIDARDRGLHYGDGLFAAIARLDGEPRRLGLHLERLGRGCARLGIASPEGELLRREIHALAGDEQRAVVKVVVTRGMSVRGLHVDSEATPTRIIGLHPWPSYPAEWSTAGV